MRIVAISLLCAAFAASSARAQIPLPTEAPPPDGATLFKNQCGTCHVLGADEPKRQGPPLGGVVGRKAGSVAGFKYSAGFADADWVWDETHLDAWLTKPQAVIKGAVMLYSQNDPAKRKLIIDWLKEQK